MPEEILETPQPTTEPKPTNWPKIILAAVLGLGLLAGAAYAGYWYGIESSKVKDQISNLQLKTQIPETPTPETITPPQADKTASWEVYENRILGISFKYPSDYVVSETGIMGSIRVSLNNKDQLPAIGNLTYEMGIDYLDNPQRLTSKQALDEWVVEKNPKSVNERKEVMVGGVRGYQGVFNYGAGSNPEVFTFASNDDKMLRTFFAKGSTEYPVVSDQEVVFNQILSTFKFLD